MSLADPGLLGGLQAGLLHPFTVPAHVVALLGLGLMIGEQRRRAVTLLALALGLLVGLAALAWAVGETAASIVLLGGAAVAGLTAAIGRPMPMVVAAPVALVIGASLGLDSPPQAASIQAANAALIGTGLGAFGAVAVAAAMASRLRRGWLRFAPRVLGSWIAASAILVIALRLAR
jgi:hypothetical protein